VTRSLTRPNPRALCMLVHGPYPIGEPRVERQARAARDAGWEVDVLATRRRGEPTEEQVEGIRVRRLPLEHRRGVGLAGALREYVGFTALAGKELARGRRSDVVHVHAPPDFLIAAALVPRHRGARVILDVHDLSSDMFAMRFGDRTGARTADRLLRLLERASASAADAVVTVHEPYRAELERRGVPAEKLLVLMNSVDESHLPPSTDSRSGAFLVVYHGTITPHYGVDLLVRAAAQAAKEVDDLRLELYGDGDELPAVRRLAAELGLSERMTTSDGYLPHGEVLARVAGANVGVVPNRPTQLNRFALSSKLFEYVALGVPVAAADLPTLRGHFSDDEVRFFRAGDESALTQALVELASHPGAARQRAEAARRRYETYEWPAQARRYVTLLDQLIQA
jgi:glycosyltransferase involved in cell wall biosynthesis